MGIINKLTSWYFTKSAAPYWMIVLVDVACFFASWFFVYGFFVGFHETVRSFFPLLNTLILFLIPQIVFFKVFHTYSVVARFSSFVDLFRIVNAVFFGGLCALTIHYLTNLNTNGLFAQTRVVQIFFACILLMSMMIVLRVMVKYLFEVAYNNEKAIKAFVYGIMEGGIGIAKNIRNEKPARFNVCGFISNNPSLNYTQLLGQKVYDADEKLTGILKDKGVKAVIVSPTRNNEFRHNQALQDYILSAGVKIYMATRLNEWDPSTSIMPVLNEVKIEDLLPREQITVDMESIGRLLRDKKILITGSAGSIGSEIVRQIASFAPASMLLIDQAETPQHSIRLEMASGFPDVNVSTVVTSITYPHRMEKLFEDFRPDYVFHAAAYKHVPMMEDNPSEAIVNNVLGTKIIADLSVRYGVKKFVMISTDKAVNPTNVMGASKRICEIYVQSLNKAELEGKVEGNTQFVTTRFGNVLGSNGSVIPLFEQQIRNGGPVTVTDPNIVRFFMLIPEACKLVLEAGTMGKGGEIFVFDMGAPVKIVDLAKRMIKLSGAEGIEIKYTGLREGEKLYEEVLAESENTLPSVHEKIRVARVREYDYDAVNDSIVHLIDTAKSYDPTATVRLMKEIVPEYISNNSRFTALDK